MKNLCVHDYHRHPPPEPSPAAIKWLRKINAGWRPNRRVRGMGYYERAEFYNVYLWELTNVIDLALDNAMRETGEETHRL
jgi:hypothetical protein